MAYREDVAQRGPVLLAPRHGVGVRGRGRAASGPSGGASSSVPLARASAAAIAAASLGSTGWSPAENAVASSTSPIVIFVPSLTAPPPPSSPASAAAPSSSAASMYCPTGCITCVRMGTSAESARGLRSQLGITNTVHG